jgi:ribosomal protein L11 methyltransferase
MTSKQQQWSAVSVIAAPEAAEAIESAFNELDSLGSEINDFRRDQKEDITVTGYFEKEPDHDLLTGKLEEFLHIYGHPPGVIRKIERTSVENTDWLYEWKKHWKPTETGRFIVTPPWEEVAAGEKMVITIEPAMAFGTGTHETTRLCLQAIGEHYSADQSFLDVGTGTGLLAIAAAKIAENTAPIFACDTDPDAITNARENALINAVADQIEFAVGPISAETPVFDFVCANLTLDVIVPILGLLLAKSDRYLVLSGILSEQEKEIVAELGKYGVSDAEVEQSGEWISVIVSRHESISDLFISQVA